MKRSFVFFGTLMIAAMSFTSCNKSLKDDVKALKKQNSELQEQLGGIANALGSDEPIKATTSFKDRDNVSRTKTDTYLFKASGTSTQQLVRNGNGTYDIYLERFGDVNWNEGAWVAFNYNPTTKAITNKRGGQYWDDYGNYSPRARYDEDQYSTGLTFNINIKSLDLTTGVISLEVNMAGTDEYSNLVDSYYVPRRGAAVSTTLSFDGKLRVYERYDD